MLIVASDRHRAHRMLELDNGVMVDSSESPERADLIAEALRSAGHEFMEPSEIDLDLLRRVHDADYVDFLATAWERWVAAGEQAAAAMGFIWPARGFRAQCPSDIVGQLGYYSFTADSSIVPGTYDAVVSSAAIAMTAADRLVDGGQTTYGLCRPPGHHATADQFGGYCFLNNAAIAAQRLRDRGMARVGVIDVDYHHGNGTQSILYERSDIVFTSIHASPDEEFPWFAGFADETGDGDGAGANLNVPLPKGADSGSWFSALATALEFLSNADLDALVVSLGVDAYEDDPLGTFQLTTPDFGRVGNEIGLLGVPTVVVQEGGYAGDAIGANVNAFLTAIH
jgi:acetoin utilization deacetylase AcuC-like enzyme